MSLSEPLPQNDLPHHFRLKVTGLNCANCARSAQKALAQVPGVDQASVNFALEKADVRADVAQVSLSDLKEALKGAGYEGEDWSESLASEPSEASRLALTETTKLILAIVLTLPLVLPMLRLGIPRQPALVQLLLTLPVQFWLGARFYKGAWHAIKNRAGSMDVLVSLGTSAAFVYSLALIATAESGHMPHLYFEASAVIITLVLLGKWLESRAKDGAGEAIRLLMALRPETARIKRGDRFIEIPAADVLPGDHVLIKPGERFPVDGQVLSGRSDADLSNITGESLPVALSQGSEIYGGAVNGSGAIELTATTGADTSMLARIIELVENAQEGRAPVQQLVDKISAIFVPAVIGLSLLTLVGWLAAGASVETALITAISVLVIACPCALGLATPTALVAGLGAAAKSGILIRDIEALERANAVDLVVFDKTGTLTEGRPEVRAIHSDDPDRLLQFAASVQVSSEHLFAQAILGQARKQELELKPVENFQNWVGEGVSAIVGSANIAVGNRNLMERFAVSGLSTQADSVAAGVSRIFVASDGQLLGTLDLADEPRSEAASALTQLKQSSIGTLMLSGDAARTAVTIGQSIGVDEAQGDLKPEDKVMAIRDRQSKGHKIAMVGDGVNDAPALAQADVGIAMGSGTDVAMATAGITLMRPDPRLVGASLDIARATRRKIRQNLGWAFVYNVIGLPLAALGFLSPAFAAGAMAASSVSVVTNSLLLRRWSAKLD
jgi:Cu+-exporting ATPase